MPRNGPHAGISRCFVVLCAPNADCVVRCTTKKNGNMCRVCRKESDRIDGFCMPIQGCVYPTKLFILRPYQSCSLYHACVLTWGSHNAMQLSAPNARSPEPFTSQSAAAGFLFPPTDTNSVEMSILRPLRCGVVSPATSHHSRICQHSRSAPNWVSAKSCRSFTSLEQSHLASYYNCFDTRTLLI